MANYLNTAIGAKVEDLVAKYGCISTSQVPYFLSEKEQGSYSQEAIEKAVKALEGRRFIERKGSFIHLKSASFDQKMIDSIWAMIDMNRQDNGENAVGSDLLAGELENSYKLPTPETLGFVKGASLLVRTLAIETEPQIATISLVQDKIYDYSNAKRGEESKISSVLLIIIREKKFIGKIARLGLTIPHKIALLDGGLFDIPTITYYGNQG